MNGKLIIRGRIETYPFRIPMPLSSRIALIKAGIKVGRQVLRYASITRPSPGEDPSRRQQRIYDLLLSALAEGAAGVMAGTANVVPAELVAVYDAVSAGNLGQAREAWARVYPLIDAIMAQPFIAAVKAALAAVGFPAGKPREPVAGLDPAAVTRIGELAAGLQRVAAS
jgi:hypothetical protein